MLIECESAQGLLERVRKLVKSHPSQTSAARELGITPQYLTDVLYERRMPSEKIAKYFGLTRTTVFVGEGFSNAKT